MLARLFVKLVKRSQFHCDLLKNVGLNNSKCASESARTEVRTSVDYRTH